MSITKIAVAGLLVVLCSTAVSSLPGHIAPYTSYINCSVFICCLGYETFRKDHLSAYAFYWAWNLVFMGFGAVVVKHYGFPWGAEPDVYMLFKSDSAVLSGALSVIVVSALFRNGNTRERSGAPMSSANPKSLCYIGYGHSIVATCLLASLGGSLFSGKSALATALNSLAQFPGGGSLWYLATASSLTVPALLIAAYRMELLSNRCIIVISGSLGLLVCNPLTGSRFLFLGFITAVLVAALCRSRFVRVLPWLFILSLITVFPSLDLHRGDGSGSKAIAFTSPVQTLQSPDFDAYEFLYRSIVLVENYDFTLGFQSVVVAVVRPLPILSEILDGPSSSSIVASSTGFQNSNVSMPLVSEGTLAAGITGSALFVACWALVACVVSRGWDRSVGGLLSGGFVASSIMLFRGALYGSLQYILFVLILWLVLMHVIHPEVRSRYSLVHYGGIANWVRVSERKQ